MAAAASSTGMAGDSATSSGSFDALLGRAADILLTMQTALANSTLDLPPYEIRAAQKAITDFNQRMVEIRETNAPKKKFAFSSRSKKVGDATPAVAAPVMGAAADGSTATPPVVPSAESVAVSGSYPPCDLGLTLSLWV
jgi:hypothetical protein